MSKDGLISVRIPDELRDRVRALAQAEGVTMSEYVRAIITPDETPYADPVFATRAERIEFEARIAADKAVMDWVDRGDNNVALIGCTPSMIAGVAVNAYKKALGHD